MKLRSSGINCGATYIPNTTQRQERTQTLIQAIHNAPLLERLVFRYPILKIADMETLHAGATRLKNVEFLDPDIYAGKRIKSLITTQRLSNHLSFKILLDHLNCSMMEERMSKSNNW